MVFSPFSLSLAILVDLFYVDPGLSLSSFSTTAGGSNLIPFCTGVSLRRFSLDGCLGMGLEIAEQGPKMQNSRDFVQ